MLYFTNWFIVMLLGATPTESKDNFIEWVDDVVASIATERCRVYLFSGEKDDGNYANLSTQQFLAVLAKFSKPQQWISDIIANNYSCGGLLMLSGGGKGRLSQQGMYLGPFQI